MLRSNATYIVYGKLAGMKRFKPVNRDRFVTNRIHAEMFTLKNFDDVARLQCLIDHLNRMNDGTFQARKVA